MAARGKLTRGLWIALGCACPGLGTIGVVLPILPTVPFYMATVFCFAKSSERLHDWFVGTSLYEKRLEGLVARRTMTMTDKLRVVWSVTLVRGIGFALMSKPFSRLCGYATCSTSSCACRRYQRGRRPRTSRTVARQLDALVWPVRKVDEVNAQPKELLPARSHLAIPIELYLVERTKVADKRIPGIENEADRIRAMSRGLDHLTIDAAMGAQELPGVLRLKATGVLLANRPKGPIVVAYIHVVRLMDERHLATGEEQCHPQLDEVPCDAHMIWVEMRHLSWLPSCPKDSAKPVSISRESRMYQIIAEGEGHRAKSIGIAML